VQVVERIYNGLLLVGSQSGHLHSLLQFFAGERKALGNFTAVKFEQATR
jgi:hypothetical protein